MHLSNEVDETGKNGYLTLDNIIGINFAIFKSSEKLKEEFSTNLSHSFMPTHNM
ncbi:hypothetical protein O3P16_00560 [Chitinophagaceae bacterium LY-5]|uniref:Uncharacterized protein n=1 Tax=Polluticaenibacter yanchengensis TaxID=3014562 RepID=A0ABT4UGE9_9BACT|nr:hypothetical protein [Chitinophagaceae bacterium LY-5]